MAAPMQFYSFPASYTYVPSSSVSYSGEDQPASTTAETVAAVAGAALAGPPEPSTSPRTPPRAAGSQAFQMAAAAFATPYPKNPKSDFFETLLEQVDCGIFRINGSEFLTTTPIGSGDYGNAYLIHTAPYQGQVIKVFNISGLQHGVGDCTGFLRHYLSQYTAYAAHDIPTVTIYNHLTAEQDGYLLLEYLPTALTWGEVQKNKSLREMTPQELHILATAKMFIQLSMTQHLSIDLSPENLRYAADGTTIKIVDFGEEPIEDDERLCIFNKRVREDWSSHPEVQDYLLY